MKAENVSKMMSTALITLGIALAAFWPAFTNATDEGNAVGPKITDPQFVAGGVEMRLKAVHNRTFREGEEPAFEVTAVNTTDEPTSVTVGTLMTSSPKANRMSRTLPRSVSLWKAPLTISLRPRETKTVTESTDTKLPPNTKIDVYLGPADAAQYSLDLVPMLSFSTAVELPAQ